MSFEQKINHKYNNILKYKTQNNFLSHQGTTMERYK